MPKSFPKALSDHYDLVWIAFFFFFFGITNLGYYTLGQCPRIKKGSFDQDLGVKHAQQAEYKNLKMQSATIYIYIPIYP